MISCDEFSAGPGIHGNVEFLELLFGVDIHEMWPT